ncbi:aminotransferase, LLPSF_NHT_00031 family [Fodinibius roseus]|uniref:GDP-perosamine synthase n=1 Tax=Fodinibius roseus TaxID=1194090 RepID=A0A1M5J220_9BACT|nr:LegC family aminotransferase [Fodinibius roseus]SHG34551.1 aminotransferase, LLPSF_NHT_00031 family [Fodinibius roseus]
MSDLIDNTVSFIRDYYETNDVIPLHEPRFTGNEKEYVANTIDSTFVSSVGAYVDQFEENIAEISETDRGVAVVNGTAALQVALRLSGVSQGDEVLTQALTFIATANAIRYNGAKPVFLDVDRDTMGLSPRAVQQFLEEYGDVLEDGCYNKKTGNRIAACVPMHTFGFPVHLNELLSVCEKWNIPVVEDAAESLGSLYHGKSTGSFGEFGIFSFNGNKIVTAGGGGAIVTNDQEKGNHAKHLTTTAKKSHDYEYYHDELGYNYRMPNLNAALICAQLEQLDRFIDNKRSLAEKYSDFFEKEGITFRTENPGAKVNYWLMCVELEDRKQRDDFLEKTNEKGIMTRPIWQLMYRLPMYKDCFRDDQMNAEYLEDRIVNIPSSVYVK